MLSGLKMFTSFLDHDFGRFKIFTLYDRNKYTPNEKTKMKKKNITLQGSRF